MVSTTPRAAVIGRPETASSAGNPARPETSRLPRPPAGRRPGLAALAVLLIVGGAALAGILALQFDERVPVLVAATDIVAGQRITTELLAQAPVAADGVDTVAAEERDTVVGSYARQAIARGRLLDHAMLTTSGLLTDDTAAVGLVLKAGQVPASGLEPGDRVTVVRVDNGKGTEVATDCVISSVVRPEDGGLGEGQDLRATVIVPRAQAVDTTAAAAAGQIAIVLLKRGAPLPGASLPRPSGAPAAAPATSSAPAAPAPPPAAAAAPPAAAAVAPAPAAPAPAGGAASPAPDAGNPAAERPPAARAKPAATPRAGNG